MGKYILLVIDSIQMACVQMLLAAMGSMLLFLSVFLVIRLSRHPSLCLSVCLSIYLYHKRSIVRIVYKVNLRFYGNCIKTAYVSEKYVTRVV